MNLTVGVLNRTVISGAPLDHHLVVIVKTKGPRCIHKQNAPKDNNNNNSRKMGNRKAGALPERHFERGH